MLRPILYLTIALLTVIASYNQNSTTEQQLDELLTKQFKPTEPGCVILVQLKNISDMTGEFISEKGKVVKFKA